MESLSAAALLAARIGLEVVVVAPSSGLLIALRSKLFPLAALLLAVFVFKIGLLAVLWSHKLRLFRSDESFEFEEEDELAAVVVKSMADFEVLVVVVTAAGDEGKSLLREGQLMGSQKLPLETEADVSRRLHRQDVNLAEMGSEH